MNENHKGWENCKGLITHIRAVFLIFEAVKLTCALDGTSQRCMIARFETLHACL